MAHHVVLEATTRRGASAAVEVQRFGLAWAPGRGFDLTPLQVQGPKGSLLATGEHVQGLLESAGYWLEAASFDALFTLDDRIRQVEAPVFLVRDPGSGRVGVCTTAGEMLGPPVLEDRSARLSHRTAGRLLEVAAPIGYRSLISPALAGAGARGDEVAGFVRAVERVWGRQGVVNVRDVQDWAMARTDGDRSRVSKVEARLAVGATGFWSAVRLTVAISVLRDHPGRESDPRPTVHRSTSTSASISLTASRQLGQ